MAASSQTAMLAADRAAGDNYVLTTYEQDLVNYDVNNTDINKVLAANHFSAYKGLHVRIWDRGSSMYYGGTIYLSKDDRFAGTLLHEYGHYIQVKQLGIIRWHIYVAIPSLISCYTDPNSHDRKPFEMHASLIGGAYGHKQFDLNSQEIEQAQAWFAKAMGSRAR